MSDINHITAQIDDLGPASRTPELDDRMRDLITAHALNSDDENMLLEMVGLRPYVSGHRLRVSQTKEGRAEYYQKRREARAAARAAKAARIGDAGGDDPAQGRMEVPGPSTPAGAGRVGDPRGVPLARA